MRRPDADIGTDKEQFPARIATRRASPATIGVRASQCGPAGVPVRARAVRVLVACEYSGVVRDAFRARGHEAWSCDIDAAEDGSPYHLLGDVLPWLRAEWDLLIAHPPCTDLAVSGARWFKAKGQDRQQQAVDFVYAMMAAPVPRIAVENPIGRLSSLIRKPDQIVQPYQFWHLDEPGKGEVKRTCFWLKGLHPLTPTTPDEPGRHPACWLMGPSETRGKDRSRTYRGIADAIADQWSRYAPSQGVCKEPR